jgi:hypothetical protein
MTPMNRLDIDWVALGAAFSVVFTLMLVAMAVLAGMKFYERFGERYEVFLLKLDAYLFERPKKFDQRKVRKIR